jgi:hypothetical protein
MPGAEGLQSPEQWHASRPSAHAPLHTLSAPLHASAQHGCGGGGGGGHGIVSAHSPLQQNGRGPLTSKVFPPSQSPSDTQEHGSFVHSPLHMYAYPHPLFTSQHAVAGGGEGTDATLSVDPHDPHEKPITKHKAQSTKHKVIIITHEQGSTGNCRGGKRTPILLDTAWYRAPPSGNGLETRQRTQTFYAGIHRQTPFEMQAKRAKPNALQEHVLNNNDNTQHTQLIPKGLVI